MKRLFQISILLIAFLLTYAVQTGYSRPLQVDQNVGCLFINVDQTQVSIPLVADISIIGESRYSCTWEKTSLLYCIKIENENTGWQCVYQQPTNLCEDNSFMILVDTKTNNTAVHANTIWFKRSPTRLDIGEKFLT
jgi:hypothetical protein